MDRNNSYHVYDGHDLYEDASRSQTLVEEFYQLQSASPSQKDDCVEDSMTKELSQKSRGMSQSRSDANIMYRRHPTRIDTSLDCEYSEPGNRHPASCDSFSSSSGYPSRGRFASRTPSPMKLDNINEDLEVGCSPSPPKRSRSPVKQLFGEHGWLGRSTSMKELPSDEFRKTGIKHWGGKLKQRVGEMVSPKISSLPSKLSLLTPRLYSKTGDVSKLMASNIFVNYDLPKYSFPPNSQFPISLDPPAQSRFYREIELMICATANQYLMTQARAGRMTVESLQKIKQFWASKNRPQVMEFQYDQTTQRDLVLYNLKTFRFFGPNAENPVAMNAMMLAWRTLAREMSVRTFCTPDSVIRKQLHDGYKILEMLGGTPLMFLAFQQMQVTCLQIMHDEQARREGFRPKKFGVERKWEPRSEDKFKSMEMENPFA